MVMAKVKKVATPKKKSDLKKAKAKAWAVFSQYIRRKYADEDGNCRCVTCGTVKHWKELHAGHYIDGRNNSVLYNEQLVHPQCFHCNSKMLGCLGGNKVAYTIFMATKYCLTMEEIGKLQNLYFTAKPMKAFEHSLVEEKYRDALVGLDIRDNRS